MKISMIAAMDKNRVIGKDNKMPWHLPKELQYVRKLTMGKSIIMGRKNFESIVEAIGKPLDGRRNIVMTTDTSYKAEGCEVVHSIEEVLELCKDEKEIFIFGGEQIYKLFMPLAEKLYITKIKYEFEGDTYFPEFDEVNDWEEIARNKGVSDEKNIYTYYYHIYERRK